VTVWREVQDALYSRFSEMWADRTPFRFANEEPIDPPSTGEWIESVLIQRRPGGPGTIGSPGNRKMDRRGVVYILLRGALDVGSGPLADRAQEAADVFENCRVPTHHIRFETVDVGEASLIEDARRWGVTVEAPFDYEETK
jgi:hypothetical protein